MLASGGEERRVPRYTALFREGSAAHSFYVLLKGRIETEVSSTGQRVEYRAPNAQKEGICLGHEGLSGGLKRLTTATALDECVILHFPTNGLLLDASGAAGLAANVFGNVVASALRGTQFFEGLPESIIEQLAPLFKLEEVPHTNTVIYREGDAADKTYLLIEGSVGLWSRGVQVSSLPEQSDLENSACIFGESAIVNTEARALTAISQSPVKLLVLPRPKFRTVHELLPDLKGQMRRYNMLRKRRTLSVVESSGASPDDPLQQHKTEEAALTIQKTARGKSGRRKLKQRIATGLAVRRLVK